MLTINSVEDMYKNKKLIKMLMTLNGIGQSHIDMYNGSYLENYFDWPQLIYTLFDLNKESYDKSVVKTKKLRDSRKYYHNQIFFKEKISIVNYKELSRNKMTISEIKDCRLFDKKVIRKYIQSKSMMDYSKYTMHLSIIIDKNREYTISGKFVSNFNPGLTSEFCFVVSPFGLRMVYIDKE